MAATATEILRVRSLADVSESDYDDATITAVIELYPRVDSARLQPDDDDWTATYDIYRAAADIVDQRAVKIATQYDTTADGVTLNRSQAVTQLQRVAASLRARGSAQGNITKAALDTGAVDDDDDEEGNG